VDKFWKNMGVDPEKPFDFNVFVAQCFPQGHVNIFASGYPQHVENGLLT
jgi:hypothetical protein